MSIITTSSATLAVVSHLPSSFFCLSSNNSNYSSSSSTSHLLPLPAAINNICYGGSRRNNKSKSQQKAVSSGGSVVTRCFYTTEETTLYHVLGFPERSSTCNLSSSDIKKAYKEMARKYHPDVCPPERVDEYTRKFILVHEAYETLSDPHARALYDRDLLLSFNNNRSSRYHQRQGRDRDESLWTMKWRSQLDGLKRRRDVERQTSSTGGDMSWGARMRSQRSSSSSS